MKDMTGENEVRPADRIDLESTLIDSAQSFVWKKYGADYAAVINGVPTVLREDGGSVSVVRGDAQQVRQYLDLDRDYTRLRTEYAALPGFAEAYDAFPGLRVLRQPAWDTLIQFILSANNNVKRITGLVQGLAGRLGKAYEEAGYTLHALPDPETLAGAEESELRGLGMGYRAPYLIRTARMVADGFPLEECAQCPYEEARKRLVELPGVGGKVADCVLLFGLGHTEAFPVDTWMEKVLRGKYGCTEVSREKLAERARGIFGADGGLIQQYLFHAARMDGGKKNEVTAR